MLAKLSGLVSVIDAGQLVIEQELFGGGQDDAMTSNNRGKCFS